MLREGSSVPAAFLVLILLVSGLSPYVFGSPSSVEGSISIDRTVKIVQNRINETEVFVPGTFRVDNMDLQDQPLITSADLSISGEATSASLSQSHWDSVEEYNIYDFEVTVIIPADSPIGPYDTFTLTLTFTNLLGTSTSDPRQLSIDLIANPNNGGNPDDGPDDDGNVTTADVGNPFPIWIIFVGGLGILLAGGAVWVFRNVEMVREEDGGRRIMMKEKKVYRKKDIEELSLEDDQL
ncbi:MAG: hypothetical protein ACMUIG_06910 [Thermoplasmatota archaeon]